MGRCQSRQSKVCPGRSIGLSPAEIDIVRNTWTVIEGRKEQFGVHVYICFLSWEKELRQFFPQVIMENNQETITTDDYELRRHALLVMDGLGLAVEYLNNPVKLHQFLHNLGVHHFQMGVKPEMLPKLYPSIDRAMQVLLGKKYKHSIRCAWRKFFFCVTQNMMVSETEAKTLLRVDM